MNKKDERRAAIQMFFNRPPREPWQPSEYMKLNRMGQNWRRECEPFALNSVIRLNENYLEVVNPHYHLRGLFAPVLIPLGMFGVGLTGWFIWHELTDSIMIGQPLLRAAFLSVVIVGLVVFSGMLYSGLRRTIGYTHKPVRFVRSTRTVHAFRHNRRGGVISLPWDDIHFCREAGLMGYIPDAQGRVTQAFWFGGVFPDTGTMYDHWEYIRRYMEEGPAAVPEPEVMLPIDGRCEPFWFGMLVCFFMLGPILPIAIAASPLTMLSGLFRYVGMHLSIKPKWPQYVEDECHIDPDDTYAHKPRPPLGIPYNLLVPVAIIALALDAWFFYWFIGMLAAS